MRATEGISNTPIESAPFVSSSIDNIAMMSHPQVSQQDPMVYSSPLMSAIDSQAPYNVTQQEQQKLTQIADGTSPLTAQDLLPKYNEANNSVSKILQDQNFLISGFALCTRLKRMAVINNATHLFFDNMPKPFIK